MNTMVRRIAVAVVGASVLTVSAMVPAFAGDDVTWRIDPDTLPPAQRQQALTARLGSTGPFGEPVMPGCIWTRIQLLTTQGVRWMLEEDCNNKGTWDW